MNRFAAIVSTLVAVDSVNVWAYRRNGPETLAGESVHEVLGELGVAIKEVDITAQGSKALVGTRLVSTILTVGLAVHLLFTSNYPLVKSDYGYTVHVCGLKRFTTFTCWCWLLLTAYFSSVTYLTLVDGATTSVWLPVLYEVCFSTAILVTLVVHFVLIPAARRKDPYRLSRLLNWRALVLHYANTTMMLVEATLSRQPIHLNHWMFPLMYCNLYLVFAWFWHYQTGVYYYFFLDYNKFWWAPFAYLGLFFALGAVWYACSLFVNFLDMYILNSAEI